MFSWCLSWWAVALASGGSFSGTPNFFLCLYVAVIQTRIKYWLFTSVKLLLKLTSKELWSAHEWERAMCLDIQLQMDLKSF